MEFKNHGTHGTHGKILFEEESYTLRGVFYDVYRELGCGFLEAVYQEAVEYELQKRNIEFLAQPPLHISYKGIVLKQTYKPDFICFDKIIIEIKSCSKVGVEHHAQLHNYLKACNKQLGFLVNFGHHPDVHIVRIVK